MAATPTPRRRVPMRLVVQINAVVSLIFGVLMLSATWKDLYAELELPAPRPWVYAQILGAVLVGLAYLLWHAARDDAQTRLAARGLAIMDGVAFAVIAVWVLSDDPGVPSSGSLGSWIFDATAVVLAVLAVLEARAFRSAD
jgi:cytochrome bd-type quinol oxidase subunit 2